MLYDQKNPPVICEQGPSTPSSPTVSSNSSHFPRIRIPSLVISDSIDQMNSLTPEYPYGLDCNKLTPYRTYSTSDLGSSPQSTSSTNSNSLGNPWSAFRDYRKSNPESDTDSDVFSKDLLSPSAAFSPSPFSPFSDCSEPPDTPQSLSANLGNSPSISPHLPLKSLHFSFDDAASVEDDMDWSDLPEALPAKHEKEVKSSSSHRFPNFTIETVLSFSDEDTQAEAKEEQMPQQQQLKQQNDENAADNSCSAIPVDEGFIDDSVRHCQIDEEKDGYVERQLAEWKTRFNEQNRLLQANQLDLYPENPDARTNAYRFQDWNGLERVGGPLVLLLQQTAKASSLWHRSQSTPNIATVTYPCTSCSEVFEKQEDLQRHITLQHPDMCEMSINVRRCLLCKKYHTDELRRRSKFMKFTELKDAQGRNYVKNLSFLKQTNFCVSAPINTVEEVQVPFLITYIFEDNEALRWHVVSKHPNGNDSQLTSFKCQKCGLSG
uniref:C2H2-type domain-containing protein n=1 Tax=Syphacia muris TaxID=451379 RepID=A0A0N5AXR7_9BILA